MNRKFYSGGFNILFAIFFIILLSASSQSQINQQEQQFNVELLQGLLRNTQQQICEDINNDGEVDCCDINANQRCDYPNECIYGASSDGQCAISCDKNNDGICNLCDDYNEATYQTFYRGDANQNGNVDITDAIFILNNLFRGSLAPQCQDSADINDDGRLDITDAIYLLNYLFNGGKPPVTVSLTVGAEACNNYCSNCETYNICDYCNSDGTCKRPNDFWEIYGKIRWCDISTPEDSLTCNDYRISTIRGLPEKCDSFNTDEDKDNQANENCPNIYPQLLAFTINPIIISPYEVRDHGFLILEISNERDLISLETKIISGVTEEEINPDSLSIIAQGNDLFPLKPSGDELSRIGFSKVTITGWPLFWSTSQIAMNTAQSSLQT